MTICLSCFISNFKSINSKVMFYEIESNTYSRKKSSLYIAHGIFVSGSMLVFYLVGFCLLTPLRTGPRAWHRQGKGSTTEQAQLFFFKFWHKFSLNYPGWAEIYNPSALASTVAVITGVCCHHTQVCYCFKCFDYQLFKHSRPNCP